jgi:hypothetical protein
MPMFIWLLLLAIGLLIKAMLMLTTLMSPQSGYFAIFNGVSNFILLLPGAIILPVVVGAVIGAEIGRRVDSFFDAVRVSVLTAVYACIIYLVALFVVYAILLFTLAGSQPSYNFVVVYWLTIPLVALIGVMAIFSVISYSRKVS